MKKILLLGDSIRKGYDRYVKASFEGIAEVRYPDENCRFTSYVIRYVGDWVKKSFPDGGIDLVYWNAGLWDLLRLADGEPLTPLPFYRENIRRICSTIRLLCPGAEMIFASSTPVCEELYTGYRRFNADIEAYNRAAQEIVTQNGGKTDDLYALLRDVPRSWHSDLTHYYTKEGTRCLTEHIVGTIGGALGIAGTLPDFDALFSSPDEVTGI